MLLHPPFRVLAGVVLATCAVTFAPTVVHAQAARDANNSSGTYSEAVARARQTSRPLIVFGTTPLCSRCAALKQGIETQSDLKLLLTQYVSVEIPFGGQEFADIFQDIIRKDAKQSRSIGGPSVFIFTAAGETVYSGPNDINGMQPGDQFKKLLIDGIEKNGGLRNSPKVLPSPNLAGDVAKARKLFSDGKPLAAAEMISKHVIVENSADDTDDELRQLAKLTGLKVTRPKPQEQLEALVQQVAEPGEWLVQAAVTTAGSGEGIRAAVQLAELERIFGRYPSFAGKFDAAWKELLGKTNVLNLKAQAELVDKARQAEANANAEEAIAAYELVGATFPGTKAAELSQVRVAQLKVPKAGPPRVWKSKTGQFSVTAGLVSFDGTLVQLQAGDGKNIAVALDSLSSEDQKFLLATKSAP